MAAIHITYSVSYVKEIGNNF